MKYLRFFLISVVLLAVVYEVNACGPFWYTPNGYNMYRICDTQPKSVADEYSLKVRRNCEEWQALTSESISIDDIYQAVYKMTMEELETVRFSATVSSSSIVIL